MAKTIDHERSAEHRDTATAEVIDDVRHPVARRIADVLRNHPARRRTFIVDDTENIEQALRYGVRLDSLFVTAGVDAGRTSDLFAAAKRVPLWVLSERLATSLFGGEKRARTFALARQPRRHALRDLSTRPGDIVVLDGVRLTGNIGAITRTACALGAAGLVLLDSGITTPLDRRLIRASRGLVFAIPVVLASRREFSEYARTERLALATLRADASAPLASIPAASERLALVMGSERHGVSDELDALASRKYAISMRPDAESLNVSVAAGIALYARRRT